MLLRHPVSFGKFPAGDFFLCPDSGLTIALHLSPIGAVNATVLHALRDPVLYRMVSRLCTTPSTRRPAPETAAEPYYHVLDDVDVQIVTREHRGKPRQFSWDISEETGAALVKNLHHQI